MLTDAPDVAPVDQKPEPAARPHTPDPVGDISSGLPDEPPQQPQAAPHPSPVAEKPGEFVSPITFVCVCI